MFGNYGGSARTSRLFVPYRTLEDLNNLVPVGSFITLPPRYTVQNGAVLQVLKPFWMEVNSINQGLTQAVHRYNVLYGSLDCRWSDGSYQQYEKFLIHSYKDPHLIIDPDDEEAWAMKSLAGKPDTNWRCTNCGRWKNEKVQL